MAPHFKNELAEIKSKAEALSERADKLKNKNLRDIVKSGLAKIAQALDHPDIDAASDEEQREAVERGKAADEGTKPADGLFDAMDPGRSLAAQEAHRRAVLDEANNKPDPFNPKPAQFGQFQAAVDPASQKPLYDATKEQHG